MTEPIDPRPMTPHFEGDVMKTVHKYEIGLGTNTKILVPTEHRILNVAPQKDALYVWLLVNSEDPDEHPITFHVFGTGHNIPKHLELEHIGTVQQLSGASVWHVFVEVK